MEFIYIYLEIYFQKLCECDRIKLREPKVCVITGTHSDPKAFLE